jgi:hypothetical protein
VSASQSAAFAFDLTTGTAIFGRNTALSLAPASNEKLFTTVAALSTLRPGFRYETTLSGLGIACAIGLVWSLFATIFFTLPAAALAEPMSNEARKLLAGT